MAALTQAQRTAQEDLREAARDLDALREAARSAQGGKVGKAEDAANQPIVDAWALARRRYLAACSSYLVAMGAQT